MRSCDGSIRHYRNWSHLASRNVESAFVITALDSDDIAVIDADEPRAGGLQRVDVGRRSPYVVPLTSPHRTFERAHSVLVPEVYRDRLISLVL